MPVQMPVEFPPGHRLTVRIANPSKDWFKLRAEFRAATGEIILPPDQFRPDKLVPDLVCGVCQEEGVAPVTDRVPSDRGGAVVLVLESPHEEEYGPGFVPLGPLRRKASRTKMRNQLPRLLAEAGLDRAAVAGAEVILCNPIQWQTSLHRLMQPAYSTGVQGLVRNQVWRALWSAVDESGSPFLIQDFVRRLDRYRPALVINACTADLRDLVHETLGGLPYRAVRVNRHPSYWGRTTLLAP